MAKQILTGLDLLALPSVTTPKTGSVGFGAKTDGLYQKVGTTESKLSTTAELLDRVKTPVPSGALFTDTKYTHPASHSISFITGLQDALDGKSATGHTHSWTQITGKPSTFAPSAHNHDATHLTSGIVPVARLGTNTGTSALYLRGDNQWVSPPNTNTTYSAMSVAEGKAGTATSSRTVRADYLKQIIQYYDTDTTYTAGANVQISETNVISATDTKYTHPSGIYMSSAERTKLAGIATEANKYSLPTASTTVIGGIKVGSRLSISSGTLSANVQSDNNFTTALKNKLDGIATGATSLSLGTSSTTAYRGDRGNTAYNHSQATGNPHGTTFAQISSKPTSLSGFGITDAYTKAEVNSLANYVGGYNYANGFLVKTDVARTENSMLVLHIKGNSYGNIVPINTFVQVYNYVTSDAIIQTGALNNGYKINEVKAFYYNNLVYFWVPQQGNFHTMTFQLLKAEGQVNRVASVSNSAVPTTGVEKMVTIIPRTAWFENTLTKVSQLSNDSGYITASASITGNAATATTATKLGTATVGSTLLPFYLNAGTATAITQANLRIGLFGTTAIGTTQLPIYLAANGVPTAITQANLRKGLFGTTAIGSTSRPIYIAANGVPTAITGSIANSTTGSAATLTTARTIAGVSFNGSANIAIPFANLTSKPTTLSGYGITALDVKNTAGLNSDTLALGIYSEAYGPGAVALGRYSIASGNNSVGIAGYGGGISSIGIGGDVWAHNSVAIGGVVWADNSVAIGGEVDAYNSIAIGGDVWADNSVAIGRYSNCEESNTGVLGTNGVNGRGTNKWIIPGNLAIGKDTTATESLDVVGNIKASGTLTTPKVNFGNGFTIEPSGTELVFKYNGVIKQRMLSDGTILATGGITALTT